LGYQIGKKTEILIGGMAVEGKVGLQVGTKGMAKLVEELFLLEIEEASAAGILVALVIFVGIPIELAIVVGVPIVVILEIVAILEIFQLVWIMIVGIALVAEFLVVIRGFVEEFQFLSIGFQKCIRASFRAYSLL